MSFTKYLIPQEKVYRAIKTWLDDIVQECLRPTSVGTLVVAAQPAEKWINVASESTQHFFVNADAASTAKSTLLDLIDLCKRAIGVVQIQTVVLDFERRGGYEQTLFLNIVDLVLKCTNESRWRMLVFSAQADHPKMMELLNISSPGRWTFDIFYIVSSPPSDILGEAGPGSSNDTFQLLVASFSMSKQKLDLFGRYIGNLFMYQNLPPTLHYQGFSKSSRSPIADEHQRSPALMAGILCVFCYFDSTDPCSLESDFPQWDHAF